MIAGLEILNLHAQGGMAEVYRARAPDQHGRTWYYAVKRILPELLKDPDIMRMFIEEQRIAACLVHENIVRVYDVARQAGPGSGQGSGRESDTYIVMEFLEGKDLQEVIEAAGDQGRQLPVWFALHVAREVLSALHYATVEARDKSGRALGLIHRDISPHNIFICADGQVKLTDFGVARVETAEVRTRAGVIKGKFGYMSPEQLLGQQLDFRSDLYNVGILLFETLTGQRLFFGETATQFIAAMMQNEVPPLDKKLLVPHELDGVMRDALSRNRADRPADARGFQRELDAIAQRYGIAARRGHVAQELASLFPELRPSAAPDVEPATQPVPVVDDRGVPQQARRAAPTPALDSATGEADGSVFTSKRPVEQAPSSRPSRVSRAPVPDAQVPALADDGLMPTVLEQRPDLDELGLEQAPSTRDEGQAPITEPSRAPFRAADPPSTTAPGPRIHRVVTGSRKVVFLEPTDDDAVLPGRRR